MQGSEHFDLSAAIDAIVKAISAVVCRIGFDAAIHGLFIGLIIAIVGFVFLNRNHRYGKPLIAVAKKLTIFCVILGLPGLISILTSGKLPPVNNLELSSVGLIGFWALVTLHLCMEEMNFHFFQRESPSEN